MRKLLAMVVSAALAATVALSASASSGTVFTRGDEKFVPNAMIQATLRFSPGRVNASTGETLTWTHADHTEAPHTVTIVDQTDLPASIDEVFECPVCGAALDAHFAGGLNPVVNVGAPGLDQPGDSLFFFPGGDDKRRGLGGCRNDPVLPLRDPPLDAGIDHRRLRSETG